MNPTVRLIVAAPIAALTALASADVAFDDFGPDHSGFGYQTDHGWATSGALSSVGLSENACQFTSSASGTLADVILPMSLISGTGSVQIQLVNDNGGFIGSTVLEEWTMSTTGAYGSYAAPATLLGDGSASLTDLSTYWLVATVVDESNSHLYAVWDENDVSLLTPRAYANGGDWSYDHNPGDTTGTFRIDVGPSGTPEPVTSSLGIAGIGLAFRRRLRARA